MIHSRNNFYSSFKDGVKMRIRRRKGMRGEGARMGGNQRRRLDSPGLLSESLGYTSKQFEFVIIVPGGR